MTIIDCKNCGGDHYGSNRCPFLEPAPGGSRLNERNDPMNSLEATDQASLAVAKSPSTRVSLADIEANIAAEYAFTADSAVNNDRSKAAVPLVAALSLLSICIIVMRNGFTVIGKSAPADAQNFDAELGRRFAREDAVRQIWPLMGYALRERLASMTPQQGPSS